MKIRRVLVRVVLFFIGIIDLLIPKNEHVAVFSSTGGMKWADNSKYLFKYMVRHSNLNCIWATRSKKVMDEVKDENPEYKVTYLHSITGVLTALRAKTWICDHGTSDIFALPFKDKRRKIYVLWHGIGPKVEPAKMLSPKEKEKKYLKRQHYDYLLCTSYNAMEYNNFFGLPRDRVRDYGYPRDDYIISSIPDSACIKKRIFDIIRGDEFSEATKIILYAPTYRDVYNERNEEKEYELLTKMDEYLENTNSILLWREHINTKSVMNIKISESKKTFNFGQDLIEDITEYLPGIDILITDYSSIAYDFVFLDRPIIFYMYDLEDYNEYRGIAFKIPDDFPGSIVYEINDLLTELKESLDDPDYGKDKRQMILKKFYEYTDGKACDRIYKNLF